MNVHSVAADTATECRYSVEEPGRWIILMLDVAPWDRYGRLLEIRRQHWGTVSPWGAEFRGDVATKCRANVPSKKEPLVGVSVDRVTLATPPAPLADATLIAKTAPRSRLHDRGFLQIRLSRPRLVPRDANSRGLVN